MKFTNNIIVSGTVTLNDEAYSSSWNGKLEAPTKNALWNILGAGLNYVPLTREITIDSVTYDLTQNRSWTTNAITALTGEATATGPGSVAITLTNSAVIGKVLTGLNVVGSAIVATDTILEAFGKTQNQINALVGGLNYQGVWNASTNTPTLTSSVGTKGYYYKVSVAGNTNLDGITDWEIGDLAIFNGTVWDQIDNTDSVSSVNGYTGAVSLTTDDVPGGVTNLYYTDARARAAISLTTTGSSGAATYNSTTGVFNVPNYTLSGLGGISGSGTIGYIPVFSGSTAISNSVMLTNGISVGFGMAPSGSSGYSIEASGIISTLSNINATGNIDAGGWAQGSSLRSVNVGGIVGIIQTTNLTTTDKTFELPNTSGTLALTSDLPDGTDFIQNQVASTQTAGFKISGDGTLANLTASTKVNVGSPSGTAGSLNIGQDGIYSYRSAGRYMRFNTSGTFNDFLSLGAKLVMNYGFSGTVENISMFEGSAAGDGQFIVGSPTATNARFLLKGKDTGTTNYISRWFDSGNTEKFSVRNDGQTTVASLSAGGIVKSTAGVLSIATAGTDYTLLNGTGIVEMAGTTPSYLSSTGSGNVVKETSPTLVTPNIGAATGTSVGLTGNSFMQGGLSVGVNAYQNYSTLILGGNTTSGSSQYGLITDAAMNGVANYAIYANAKLRASTSATSTYGLFVQNPEMGAGATVINNYGLYIDNQTRGGTLNYSIYSAGGANYLGGGLELPSIKITGGASNGYVLKSDASGNASWQSPTSSYKGTWNASTNTPTIADGSGTAGDYYYVTTGGTQFGRTFTTGGQAVYNGSIWEPVGVAASVTSVNGYTGAVTLAKDDVGLSNVDNTSDATKNAATATLTNKTISGSSNTLSNIPQSAVTNLTTDLSNLMPKSGGAFTGGVTGTTLGLSGSLTNSNSLPFVLSSPTSIDFHQSGGGIVRFVNDAFSSVNMSLNNSGDMSVRGALSVIGAISGSNLSGTNTGDQTTITGNAGTATALQTARNIQGVSFNGTADINPINGTGFVKATGTTLSYDNSTYLTTASASSTYAPLASPALTGNPTAPTQTAGDNSTKIATTAYVDRLGSGTITSGTYTPTLTNTSGIASSTAGTGSYQRIGNQVSGFVDFSATGTSEGVSGVFGVSLPIASNFSSATNVWGGYGVARSGETIAPLEEVSADTTNDRFIVKATLTDLSARTIRINFNYTIQ